LVEVRCGQLAANQAFHQWLHPQEFLSLEIVKNHNHFWRSHLENFNFDFVHFFNSHFPSFSHGMTSFQQAFEAFTWPHKEHHLQC